jgi:hypothetical protein
LSFLAIAKQAAWFSNIPEYTVKTGVFAAEMELVQEKAALQQGATPK